MTYKEFKAQGYRIEMVSNATVWCWVAINEDEPTDNGSRYGFTRDETEIHDGEIYRIVSFSNDDSHDYEEFNDLDELEDYIKFEM